MTSKLLRKSKNSLPIHFELGHVASSLHVVTHQNSSNVHSAGEVMLGKNYVRDLIVTALTHSLTHNITMLQADTMPQL